MMHPMAPAPGSSRSRRRGRRGHEADETDEAEGHRTEGSEVEGTEVQGDEGDAAEPTSASGARLRRAPDPPDGRMSSSVKVVKSPSAERTAAIFARLRDDETDATDVTDATETTPAVDADAAGPAEGDTIGPAEGDSGGADEDSATDAVLADLERTLARRFKRDLSDEQNELLDAVRRQKGSPMAASALPALRDQVERYRALALPVLADAAEAGAERAGDETGGVTDTPVGDLADGLAEELVLPLREQLERCFDEAAGDRDDLADRIRACYREGKAQFVDLPGRGGGARCRVRAGRAPAERDSARAGSAGLLFPRSSTVRKHP